MFVIFSEKSVHYKYLALAPPINTSTSLAGVFAIQQTGWGMKQLLISVPELSIITIKHLKSVLYKCCYKSYIIQLTFFLYKHKSLHIILIIAPDVKLFAKQRVLTSPLPSAPRKET